MQLINLNILVSTGKPSNFKD